MEHDISDERQPCRSCAGILSDSSLFDALKSEEGVNFSQTAQDFYTAVDNGCLICSEIHEMACQYAHFSESATAAFRCRPQSASDARGDLSINIKFETTRPDSFDFKQCEIALWSPEYRYISCLYVAVEAQEGRYILFPVTCVGLRRFDCLSDTCEKVTQQQTISALGQSIRVLLPLPAMV